MAFTRSAPTPSCWMAPSGSMGGYGLRDPKGFRLDFYLDAIL